MERGKFEWEIDDEDEDEMNRLKSSGKTHVVFLIDCSTSMHNVSSTATVSPFKAAILCLIRFISTKIKLSDMDKFGIIFYGTKKSKSLNSFKNIVSFLSIDKPDIQHIFMLQKLIDDQEHFDETLGSDASFSIFDALSDCAILFKKSSKLVKKFVYLVTNNDDPTAVSKDFAQALLKSQDFVSYPISLEVIGLDSEETRFSYEKFYKKLTYYTYPDEDEQEMLPVSAKDAYKELDLYFQTKVYSKRNAFAIPFIIGENLKFGVRGFNLFMEKKKPTHTYTDRKSGLPVAPQTSYICNTTGKVLAEYSFYYEFGGARVKFSKDQVQTMKSGGDPGMVLLGFRSLKDIKSKFNIRSSIFMAPDENQIIGSSSIFMHFLERCHARNKAPICKLVSRKNTSAKLVALLPQMAGFDEDTMEVTPAGFHVITLPFADDIRSIDCPPLLLPKEEYILGASNIIHSLSRPFSSLDIKNPVLEKHFATMYGLALEKEEIEAISDQTIPDPELIFDNAATFIKKFNDMIFSEVQNDDIPKPVKRPAAKSSEAAKKPKPNASEIDEAFIRDAIKKDTLKKLQVPVLVDILKGADQKIKSKKKADLLEQIAELYK